ncbi:heterokaryon incompatibility protein [Biscogniauxia sp. FL1348]|nr:heterokaryon incompatibility protein [Biscogniauxia sp. FL1348]
MEWHDGACRRLDLASIDGIESCRGCGSFKQLPPARLQPARLQPARLPPISPNDQRKKIRLLCLLPDSFVEDIKCEISVCNIDAKPKYDAISYTWADDTGSSDKIKTISISGKPFKVTHNCELALKRARYFSSPRTIWVDAVCIDQDNDQERGHQVELMPRIYSTARHVLAYVGEDKDKSGWLVQVLLMSRQDRDPDTFQRAICSFFERPYFRRAWVLQEIALAREPFLVCGNMSISWRDFVRRCSSSISKPPAVLMFNFETYTRPRQFLPLLDLARRCYASDPRDKVFALLGLAADASQSIESDYTHDVVHVYTKVAIYLASVSRRGFPIGATSERNHLKT